MERIARFAAIGLVALFLLAGVFEVFSPWHMPRPAQVALAILLVAATLWISELVPLFVTSFLILALSVTWLQGAMRAGGVRVAPTDFMAPFFSDVILLFLGGFVLSAALHKHRLDERLARRVIGMAGGSIPKILFGVMAITAFLSMWLSNTATAAMMLALCIPVLEGLPKGDSYRKAILLAIPFAANVGGLGTPIGTPPNAIAIQYMRRLGVAPSFGMWMAAGIPMVILMVAVIWVVLMAFYRGRSTAIVLAPAPAAAAKYTKNEVLVAAVGLVTVLGWLTGGLHRFSSGTVALIPVIVLFGMRILTVQDFRSLSWDVLLLMGGGLCLGTGIAASGLAGWLIARLPTEGASYLTLIVVFGVVACAMSSVMSNTATANLILPIAMGLSVPTLSPLFIGVAFACSVAMPLPISTPPNAIAFSSGEISVMDMMKPGLALTVIGLIATFALGVRWWQFIGLF